MPSTTVITAAHSQRAQRMREPRPAELVVREEIEENADAERRELVVVRRAAADVGRRVDERFGD
ncbi:hypothetical protein [Nesterenkonia sp. F]|uniref:hypothetical protein n=1 Tax=Nesterenkonia sp. F TaxID=795955 RepID=UPI001303577A|nr:hypothetical protein [Nesterenkonia sp. F]